MRTLPSASAFFGAGTGTVTIRVSNTRLSELGIAEAEISMIALDAMTEIPTLANPRKCTVELIDGVIRQAF